MIPIARKKRPAKGGTALVRVPGRVKTYSHVNMGKRYPYASTRRYGCLKYERISHSGPLSPSPAVWPVPR